MENCEQFGWALQILVLWAGLVGLALICLGVGLRFLLRVICCLWPKARRLGLIGLPVVGLLLAGLTVYGSLKNTNNTLPRAGMTLRVAGTSNTSTNGLDQSMNLSTTIADEDISNGWRVCMTNEGNRIAEPFPGITTNLAWWIRGGMDDAERYEHPNGICYPHGDLLTSGFTVVARGEVQPTIRTNFFPRPFAENLSLAPGVKGGLLAEGPSVFWTGWTASNSFVATWQHALYARNPNTQTNFQAEIFADGSFVYRYPEQEIRFERVSSFDFDGDGLANAIDPQPCEAGEDGHGQNEVWVRASFTNATEILQVGYTNWVAQTVGTNCPNGLFAFSVNIPETPGHDVHLQVGSFHVVFREPACFLFLLPVDERLDLSLSDDCLGMEYTWDDGYRGSAVSCQVDFVPPMRNHPGRLRMIPLLIVNPTELDVSTALEGALLSTFINRADVLNEWDEEFGEASFSDGENQGQDGRLTTPSNSVTVAQVSGETRLTVTAVVYNWKTNVVEMNKTLIDKRRRYLAIIDCYRLAYQNDPSTRWYEPDEVTTNVDGRVISAMQWAIMTLYNGARGTCQIPFSGWEHLSTPIHFDPVTTNWIFYTNSNDYVPRVLTEVEWEDVE